MVTERLKGGSYLLPHHYERCGFGRLTACERDLLWTKVRGPADSWTRGSMHIRFDEGNITFHNLHFVHVDGPTCSAPRPHC